ncbi:exported hypothetical protein [Candidatus Sulfopaludibacter sp. SbA4]|nr:exported hypothetical protein [Candidatus Sulfopaludibacter sp. SbA4]
MASLDTLSVPMSVGGPVAGASLAAETSRHEVGGRLPVGPQAASLPHKQPQDLWAVQRFLESADFLQSGENCV